MKLIYLTLLTLIISLTSGSSFTGRLPRGEHEEKGGDQVGIINGKKAWISKFPYMASLMMNSTFIGSGVILDKRWILTTANNAVGYPSADLLTFRVGSNRHDRGGQLLRVSEVVRPSRFNFTLDYNVAVVKVNKPIKFGKKVKPIRLGTKSLKGNTKAVIVGWGVKSTAETRPLGTLMSTVVTSITLKKCESTYKKLLSSRNMCTYDLKTGPCYYDNGDPLIFNNAVYGLALGSDGCLKYPVVYNDIPSLHKWIQSAIKH